MAIAHPHIHDVVTAYLGRHPAERPLLDPLLDLLAADRIHVDGQVRASGVVVNDGDEVLLLHHAASGARIPPGGLCGPADRTLAGAARRVIEEKTGIAGLRLLCGGEPIQIDVETIEAGPEPREPAHQRIDVRFLFRARGTPDVPVHTAGPARAEWCGPSQLGDAELRARVLSALGRPRHGRQAEEDPYGTLVVITNEAGEVLMHLRDDKEGIWAPGTWAPLGGGAEPGDADPLATGVRELQEEAGLEGVALTSMFRVDSDGYPVHVFHGRWNGDAKTLVLGEGTDLAFITPADFDRLPMNTSVRKDTRRVLDLITPKAAPYGYGTLALIRNTAGHLLMHRRDDNPGICWPGTWSPNGGKPEAHDAGPAATIRREVLEEIGLQLPLEHLFTHTADSGHRTYVFQGRWDGDPDALVLTEGTDLAFIDPRDMQGLPMSPLARYAALRGLSADLEDQAHADGIRDLACAALIVHDDAVLSVRRRPDDYLGGTWELPGGHCEKNESVLDCLTRQVRRTTGLTPTSVDRYLGHFDYTNPRGGLSRHFVFTLATDQPGPVVLTEHDRHHWVPQTDGLPSTADELRSFLLAAHNPRS
ncbi:NUDIX domain-containing protein [Streptomyces sp. CNQ-509]|uniref:NUDIX domain-containing protein n=1 Tax=Streptomyces sp. CNQ-509 TaxID=444103 RepID=UPI00099DAB58|nr:NUDIX domain-containing protein [Streptomyces sp. CNQ-509]